MAFRISKTLSSLSSSICHFNLASRTIGPAPQAFSRCSILRFHTSPSIMAENAPNTSNATNTSAYRANGDNGDDGYTEGEHNQWKFRAPYKVHDNDPNFHARYEASCHCGKIRYQLSREKPLDSKFCHCTTCQKLHGTRYLPNSFLIGGYSPSKHRSSIPMGGNLSQGRHQFYPRSSRFGLVRKLRENYGPQITVQSQLCILPYAYHG